MIKTRNISLLLCLVAFYGTKTAESTQFKLLKGKGNTYKAMNVPKNEDLEYPRKDGKILKTLQELWENYYKCIREKEKQEIKPEIHRLLEGQNTEFKCDICSRPFQNYEEIQWKYKPLSPEANITELDYLDLTPEMYLTPDKTLQIFNAEESLEGLYVCFHGKNIISVKILEVSKNDTTEKVEKPQTARENFEKFGHNFEVHYKWTNYMDCSTCGKVGKKFKYGTCYVSSIPIFGGDYLNDGQNDVNYTHFSFKFIPSSLIIKHIAIMPIGDKISQSTRIRRPLYTRRNNPTKSYNGASKASKTHTAKFLKIKIESPENLVRTKKHFLEKSLQEQINRHFNKGNNSFSQADEQKFEPEIIEKFRGGIPCASPFAKKIDPELSTKYSPVKVLVKYCWEQCQENTLFEVVDNFGKVVEIANNSAGIYSLFQKLPNVPPGIERRTIVADFGSSVIILCPGTSLTNTPVVWKVNNKLIYPDIVSNSSNGRFTVDLVNRIHIKRLRLKDSKIYSCWQKGRLVGTVHLNVEKRFKVGFNHHITLIGIVAVIGTFLLVGSKILTRELKMRKK